MNTSEEEKDHARRVRVAMRQLRSAANKYEVSGDSKDYSRALRLLQTDRFYPLRDRASEDDHARWYGVRAAARWVLLEAMQRRRDARNVELARINAEIKAARNHRPGMVW